MKKTITVRQRRGESEGGQKEGESGGLTGNGAEVEVVSDDLLVVVVH